MTDIKATESTVSSGVRSNITQYVTPITHQEPDLIILVDENTWQAIQDFDSQIHEESQALKDK